MSKNWYPIIDYNKCTNCGACFRRCRRGVFKLDENKPVVIYPEGCIQGCHGCGNICPYCALTYANDNTGWVPPGMRKK